MEMTKKNYLEKLSWVAPFYTTDIARKSGKHFEFQSGWNLHFKIFPSVTLK